MSCITEILKLKGDKETLSVHEDVVVEGGGEYKGHEYLIVFTSYGHRCGYVALLPEESDKLEIDDPESYNYPNLNCHGGVTFYSDSHAAKDFLQISCKDMWVGFDAAHYLDKDDIITTEKYFGETSYIKYRKTNPRPSFDPNETHKTYKYMEKECHSIIDQLIELAA